MQPACCPNRQGDPRQPGRTLRTLGAAPTRPLQACASNTRCQIQCRAACFWALQAQNHTGTTRLPEQSSNANEDTGWLRLLCASYQKPGGWRACKEGGKAGPVPGWSHYPAGKPLEGKGLVGPPHGTSSVRTGACDANMLEKSLAGLASRPVQVVATSYTSTSDESVDIKAPGQSWCQPCPPFKQPGF